MKRIIDADTHISPTPQQGCSIKAEELIQRIDECGVEKAYAWIHPPYERGQLDESLKYLYQSWKQYPDRIIPFGWADPNLGIGRALDTVKRCVTEYGFVGVKLNGAQNYFNINDDAVLPVVEAVAESGTVAAFHIGADSAENTHPYRLGAIARRFPDTRFLMIHMGGASFEDLSQAAIDVARELPNVTLVASAIRTRPFLKAVTELGAARVCFGSDSPFEIMRGEVARCLGIFEPILGADELDRLLYRTAAELVGLAC